MTHSIKGRKFYSKNFRELLLENSQLSMIQQKEVLETTLEEWQGVYEQIDEVTLYPVTAFEIED